MTIFRPARGNAPKAAYRIAIAAVIAMPAVAANADDFPDHLVLRNESGQGRTQMNCRIVDYTGESITIESAPRGRVQRFSTDRIVRVETPQTEPHIRGLQAFGRGQMSEAESAFQAALEIEDRQWVRRELIAMLIRCSLHGGDRVTAATRFLALIRSDPETQHFSLIPLDWSFEAPSVETKSAARLWLQDENRIVRLVGAAFVLMDGGLGDQAAKVLEALQTSPDPRVRHLAGAQLWRLRLQAGQLNDLEVDGWQLRTELIPEKLRGGGYYLIGVARQQRREFDRAAAAFLWVTFVYNEDRHLAAHACLQAADALSRVGQRAEAGNLYREVTTRFRDTPSAGPAVAALRKLADDGSNRDVPTTEQ